MDSCGSGAGSVDCKPLYKGDVAQTRTLLPPSVSSHLVLEHFHH